MAADHIRYDLLTQNAMRSVVRKVLHDAAAHGLAGEHHFFISFDTGTPGVKISPRLRAQYSREMTIVLQHQFWDLTVSEEAFEVGLSFNGIPEHLTVPFAAVTGFFDPSVKFGLQFAEMSEHATGDPGETASESAQSGTMPTAAEAVALPAPVAEPAKQDQPEKPHGGEVVRLDRFRKK